MLRRPPQPTPTAETLKNNSSKKEVRRLDKQAKRRCLRAKKKARKRGSKRQFGPIHIHSLVDTLSSDLKIPVRNDRLKFYDASTHASVRRIERLPLNYKGYFRLGIYNANELTYRRSAKTQGGCINKLARLFGIDPKKDRRWTALLRCIVCTGLNRQDFRSVMRIRDLKVRGKYKSYCRAITSFIAKLPNVHRARALDHSWDKGIGHMNFDSFFRNLGE